jgi:light-regulated signal transduction histidine kinase (bacteriophytochrome)
MEKVRLNLQAAIEQNHAQVTWEELPEVNAHEIRIVQLFQNLVGNAIKYRGEAPPVIRVAAEADGENWLFCVEDNGIGIKPEYAQQVFGIFKRLNGHTYPGTGIGLAICQRIVERYSGRIWVEPSASGGSRFLFTVPQTSRVESERQYAASPPTAVAV